MGLARPTATHSAHFTRPQFFELTRKAYEANDRKAGLTLLYKMWAYKSPGYTCIHGYDEDGYHAPEKPGDELIYPWVYCHFAMRMLREWFAIPADVPAMACLSFQITVRDSFAGMIRDTAAEADVRRFFQMSEVLDASIAQTDA